MRTLTQKPPTQQSFTRTFRPGLILSGLIITEIFRTSLASAIQQEVSSTYSLSSASGSAGQTSLTGPASGRISSNSENFGYRIQGLLSQLTLSGGVTLTQPDYSNYLLRDALGQNRSLSASQVNLTEIVGVQSFEWSGGAHTTNLFWSGSLNQSPFSYQSGTASYQISLFEKATLIGVRATYLRQEQPADYFINNRTFQNQARPRVIHASEFVGTYEQLLTDRWKMYFDLSTAYRMEERPRNVGITLGQGYALTSHVTLQAKAARFMELRSDPLLNERGYFSLTSGELALTFEPIYDLLITTSYGLLVEREFEPSTGAETQVATDQFGLGVRYPIRNIELRLQGSLGLTNTTYQILNFAGGLTWKI
jgi:hypothetical protein